MDHLDCHRMFIAVLEAGSFRGGAQRLGLSSGQASKLVAKLESHLGIQLLKRTTRAISPTELGATFYHQIKSMLIEFDNLHNSVKGSADRPSGRLVLATPTTFGTAQLLPDLIDFARLYPEIELDVDLSDRVVSLVEGGYDAAVRIGKPADSSLITRKLCAIRIVLAATPRYLETHGTPTVPSELLHHDCIIDTNFKDSETWNFRDPVGQAPNAIQIKGRLRFSSAEACLAAAKADFGIARLPSFVAGPSFKDGSLTPVLGNAEDLPGSLLVVYPPARYLAPKVRSLIDFLGARYRGTPTWDLNWADSGEMNALIASTVETN